MHLDQLDLELLNLLLEEPQAGMREYARVLGIARGTVQARLARLEREGVITGHAPSVSPAGLGFTVRARATCSAAWPPRATRTWKGSCRPCWHCRA